ncbi:hypothetical protein PGT21_013724 [Puccinia graminis f. sp. tritici]|uniref:Uncharacterized protein n=1 Tax=Puccinia graminis f. sp. tritici TaxID=56615 RepID=A0A5B0LTA1_PUCGR|nr:hypothetical protein PGTUg99_005153 [Puccinia graminis f. sp. tritici]KAA1083988.1 hypothetical protein PGT21_013724 [Puccinia graminis f. sp. tritici]
MYYSGCYSDRYPTTAYASDPAVPNPAYASWCPRSFLAPWQSAVNPEVCQCPDSRTSRKSTSIKKSDEKQHTNSINSLDNKINPQQLYNHL